MAAYTQIGYSVADIAALKAIAPADRPAFAGALVSVVSTNQWFEFDPAGASGGITPNSGSGRWYAMNREVLNADRIYFVRTDGNDNNTGLADTSGGAFLTIQKAINVVASLDISIFDVTIQIANGTYTSTITPKSIIGSGKVIIQGNLADPSTVVFSVNSGDCVRADSFDGVYLFQGMTFTASSGNAIYIVLKGQIEINNVVFGACSSVHFAVEGTAVGVLRGNYSITGNAAYHLYSLGGAKLFYNFAGTGRVITLVGTRNFAGSFAIASNTGIINCSSGFVSFSGTGTGTKYITSVNGVINTSGSGSTYFPGNVSGTTATGGQYI